MGCIYIHWSVIIESRIESHSGSHTGTFHLSYIIHFGSYSTPGKQAHGAIDHWINPFLIYAPGYAISIDGGCRCFQVGIVPVKQLMPEPFPGLIRCQALYMIAILGQNVISSRVILR